MRNQKQRDSNPGLPGRNPPLCHLSYHASVCRDTCRDMILSIFVHFVHYSGGILTPGTKKCVIQRYLKFRSFPFYHHPNVIIFWLAFKNLVGSQGQNHKTKYLLNASTKWMFLLNLTFHSQLFFQSFSWLLSFSNHQASRNSEKVTVLIINVRLILVTFFLNTNQLIIEGGRKLCNVSEMYNFYSLCSMSNFGD